MEKLFKKDKRNRIIFFHNEKKHTVLFLIFSNLNLPFTVRWNAIIKLKKLIKKNSISILNNRCQVTINKKRFSKLTNYSRHIFLRQIRFGKIHGFQKSSW